MNIEEERQGWGKQLHSNRRRQQKRLKRSGLCRNRKERRLDGDKKKVEEKRDKY
jgi:hypothetical protein